MRSAACDNDVLGGQAREQEKAEQIADRDLKRYTEVDPEAWRDNPEDTIEEKWYKINEQKRWFEKYWLGARGVHYAQIHAIHDLYVFSRLWVDFNVLSGGPGGMHLMTGWMKACLQIP